MSKLSSSITSAAEFGDHAVMVAKRQYFQPGDETVLDMFERVARWVAQPELPEQREATTKEFYRLMVEQRFSPGGRVLAGAATEHGNVLNCFVQDGAPESVGTNEWVLNLATKLALVTKVGGGNGLNLDPIPPKRHYEGKVGILYLTVDDTHADYQAIKSGTYLDLVRNEMTTKGYRVARFVERSAAPSGADLVSVPDSVEGIWDSAGSAVLGLLAGRDVLVDLSNLRPVGTPVRGSGGASSGPSSFAVEIFDNFGVWAGLGGVEYAGPVSTLRYVYAPTLRAIRQGGSRRGAGMATISITHPDVQDFITAKDLDRERDEGDISTFNISVLVTDGFMQDDAAGGGGVLRDIAQHAWATGEPGLIFIDRINEHNAMRGALGDIKSTNPCVTADTWVTTQAGPRQVSELVDRRFCAVVDGKAYGLESNGFFSTGVKQVYKVVTKGGFELRLTGNHRLKAVTHHTRDTLKSEWTAVDDLSVGDEVFLQDQRTAAPWVGAGNEAQGWLLGQLVGDGTFITDKAVPMAALDFWGEHHESWARLAEDGIKQHAPSERLWVTNGEGRSRVASDGLAVLAASFGIEHGHKRVTDEIERAGEEFYRGFLRGLFDADGSVQGAQEKGVSVCLAQSDLESLKRVQRMLARLGIVASIYEERRPAGPRLLPDGHGGSKEYQARADHELVIANDNLQRFNDLIGFEDPVKKSRLETTLAGYARRLNRERFVDEIVSIEPDGVEEVFDVTVERVHAFDANGFTAHNCGEIPLYPGEPCDLGAINLAAYVAQDGVGLDGFDMATFRQDVATCVRFLDDVLDVNRFALEDNRDMSMKLRRLGLGVMGLADALIKMGFPYNTEEGRAAVDAIISALRDAATEASEQLGEERGNFPLAEQSDLDTARRNVAILTVAPTGTTSMLMGVSSGVEPVFAPFIHRKIGADYHALIHPLFQQLLDAHPAATGYARDGRWDWDAVVKAVQDNHGSVQGLEFIPEEVRRVLICAHDIMPSDHVKMQATVQRAFDGGKKVANSISKTINMPNAATVDDVFESYRLAFETGCKGITVYRDGSRDFQVLSTSSAKQEPKKAEPAGLPAVAAKVAPGAGAGGNGVVGNNGNAIPAPLSDRTRTDRTQSSTTMAAVAAAQAVDIGAAPVGDRRASERLPGEPLFERPVRVTGYTDKVKLMEPSGEKRGFYVTVNKQDDLPTEVFIQSGKGGDEANADSEALGRVVSIALQYGVPAEALVKTLRGINGGMYGTYHGRMVASKADILAVALETAGTENVLNRGKGCPDCGAPLRFEEGCQKCESCGYSKCG